jgi:hypothetical protein
MALSFAERLFAKRLASSRNLIIASCGNCLEYEPLLECKLSKKLTERNIIVSSWGNYNMNLGSNAHEDETAIGYNQDTVYIQSKNNNNTMFTEPLNQFKVEHEGDICHRLAVKTHGSVFDLNKIREKFFSQKTAEILNNSAENRVVSVKSCEFVERKYGASFVDNNFDVKIKKNEEEDDE